MIARIPGPYKWILLAIVITGAAAAGATVATWRADAACAEKISEKRDEIDRLGREITDLRLGVAEANEAISVAEAQTAASAAAREQALEHARQLGIFSESRLEKLERTFSSATSCEDVLSSYWELRQ